ncbi:MAG: adenosine kinase [Haliea sp.]|nr:adenosine kinase [Haliea sp.]
MTKYAVYGMGAALVDTEIQVQDRELATMGVDKGLMTLVDEARQAELLDHLEGHLVHASHASGGSAGNSLIAVARFGAPAFMTCKVADDEYGSIYVDDLAASGVDHCMDGERPTGTTGKCLVLISPDAERSMNTFLGISETLSTEQLDPAALARSHWLYVEGYLVTSDSGRAAAIRARELAEQEGVKTALSFSDPGIVEFFHEGLQAMLGERVDLVFCNAEEALAWGRTDDLGVAMERLKPVARQFVVTRGAEGAIAWDGETLHEIPPHRVQAVDSNGAGDMFAGAFLYALQRGEDFPTAGRFACLAAGRVVANYGPRLPAADYPALRAEFFGD